MEGNVMNRTEYKNNFYKEHYEKEKAIGFIDFK
jgi:hypothetical protein